ncbi:MAG: T9SS type A sorting domain-containing protein [Bacteroidetes bacterium]|nr:T9SS type A sorting domain-containing protein [Bacteroidota bacterium]
MKKKLLHTIFLICFFCINNLFAQTIVFHEDFETVDSMSSSGMPAWFQDSLLEVSGSHCMRDTVLTGDSAYLVTNAFSTVGFNSVILDFWHICKISFADKAIVEVSNNNGVTWTQLTAAQYLGISGFGQNNSFSSATYGLASTSWDPFNDLSIPDNTWWKHETFDLSSITSNFPLVKVRFKIKDENSSGSDGNYGWLIDDVHVTATFLSSVASIDKHSNSINIIPNPTNGIFHLEEMGWMIDNSTITVSDVYGNETWKNSGNKSGVTTIDLSSEPSGIYFVKVVTGSETEIRKVILCK